MILNKCDRCGEYHHIDSMAVLTLIHPDNTTTKHTLCEQCYTTIKEVLEDGEIK